MRKNIIFLVCVASICGAVYAATSTVIIGQSENDNASNSQSKKEKTEKKGVPQEETPGKKGGTPGHYPIGQSAKFDNVKGTISQDGKTLVGDDGKSWTIANPDAVEGHEGHHVELKGSANSASSQIHVSSMKPLKDSKDSKKDNRPPK